MRDEPTPHGTRPVVVCVDDDPGTLAALRRALHREPYDVVALDRPAEALDLLRTQGVDVVVADERMPEMSGTELLREVGARSPTTARLMLTAHPDGALIRACRDHGIQRFLTKPWSDDDLRNAIRELIRERELAEGYCEIT